jgi:hypothetical protein
MKGTAPQAVYPSRGEKRPSFGERELGFDKHGSLHHISLIGE